MAVTSAASNIALAIWAMLWSGPVFPVGAFASLCTDTGSVALEVLHVAQPPYRPEPSK
eukprot:CAMPEP_0174764248 /NCGR_PEP_ID=MMETSP1094-20130205/110686_1 /TAXON_ID=156173 /ORGANISM="Chrysochromulina brevifilum, Strain UTEX LB 985" /LENGTH=57 /DNA_ID=CAMNT_0015970205 /DNA_START=102 /DNA_END=275 /DNA_ORIENTATION=-